MPTARTRLAERIGAHYGGQPGVAAVLFAGSAARRHEDRFSDVEIGVFWEEPPSKEVRRSAIESIGGEVVTLYPFEEAEVAWFDDWRLEGIVIDLVHMTVADAERQIAAAVTEHDPNPVNQVLIAAIVDGVPLHGEELLLGWHDRALPYPAGLARAVVEANAQIDHFWRFEMLSARREPLLARAKAVDIVQRLLRVLLAVNGIYWSGFKWLERTADRLTIAPPALLDRIRAVLLEPPEETARLLAPLVEETYDLVEAHVDGVDVERLREIFRYRRAPRA